VIAFLWLHDTASSHPSDIRVRVCIKMPSIVKKRVTFKNVEDKHEDKRDKAADVLVKTQSTYVALWFSDLICRVCHARTY